jgi:hypothetical protein
MAIRSFPRDAKNFFGMLRNLLWIRTVDGLMRMVLGQKWNDRNAKAAIEKANNNMKRYEKG